ncbi:MAG: 16S rRNA (cytosine(1402)-N(4))-methyltransferase [Gammaproteobacteria bacterium]|nr:16S rRNA (cytosine(1402)-N(4))-methyltransferase [Gammaproteobacteria bacterium]
MSLDVPYADNSVPLSAQDEHLPVLLHEVIAALLSTKVSVASTDTASTILVDGTFGRGGHSRQLLQRLSADDRLFALDRDPDAASVANLLADEDPRFSFVQARFSELGSVLAQRGFDGVDGILLDLGVSSPQLDRAERGFSFSADGPLDMRMNPNEGQSAADWLNSAEENAIATVLWEYGEERQSRRIAREIAAARPLATTLELADLVERVAVAPKKNQRKHPATRTFQAIRMHVNAEVEELDEGLKAGFNALSIGGRLAVISFHSLEDRKVKRTFRELSQPPRLPRRLPVRHSAEQIPGRLVSGAIKPGLAELNANPRARSAILRVIERVS